MEGPGIHTAEAVIDNGRFGTRTVRFETGRLARQANGAVVAYLDEDTMVLSTTTAGKHPKEQFDFFPLTVDVEERGYAAGKIPGSVFRREGRPSEDAILTCRLIDRPLRPSFVKGLRNEVQVVVTVLSLNPDVLYDVLAINAAASSTQIAGLPFTGPIGGVRVALIDGQWVAFPRRAELENAVFDMVVAGRALDDGDVAIMMVEAESTDHTWELVRGGVQAPTEEIVAEGLEAAKGFIRTLCQAQNDLAAKSAKPTTEFPVFRDYQEDVLEALTGAVRGELAEALTIGDKATRESRLDEVKELGLERIGADFEGREKEISAAFRSLTKTLVRERVLRDKVRIDGRGLADIRPLSAEIGVVPRVHGSALFERGETQILGVTTLNMLSLERRIGLTLAEDTTKALHAQLQHAAVLHRRDRPRRFAEAARDRARCARGAGDPPDPPQPRGLPVRHPPGVGGGRLQRLHLDGLGVCVVAGTAQRRCPAARAGGRHRDGPDQRRGGRQDGVRHADRHPRRRGRVRRHGLQGRRHP